MQIRIRLFTLMRIRIPIPIKSDTATADPQTLQKTILSLSASIVSIHVSILSSKAPDLLTSMRIRIQLHSSADPDPHPASRNDADPDPGTLPGPYLITARLEGKSLSWERLCTSFLTGFEILAAKYLRTGMKLQRIEESHLARWETCS
jgi:hypothetical protein